MSNLTQSERAAAIAPPRAHLFAALTLLAVGNAVTARALMALHDQGLSAALVDGLGMSWAFWLALALAVRLALTAPPVPASRGDMALAALALVLIASPFRQASSLAA